MSTYIHNGSMKKQGIHSSNFLVFLSTWFQRLGLKIEEFLVEISISADKVVVCRAGGVFFESRIPRARGTSPSIQGGALAIDEPRHQVL